MSNTEKAHRSFLATATRIYQGVDTSSVQTIEDPSLSVPGFVTLEVQAQVPVRGWVRGELVVVARTQNFGPVLEALDFADDVRWSNLDALVARLVWLHGPPYQLVTHLAEGERGAPDELDLTPNRERRRDGRIALHFALLDPGGASDVGRRAYPSSVFQYRIIRLPDGAYNISTTQVAPLVD